MENNLVLNKSAQVTIYIIVAVVVIAVILGVLFLSGGKELIEPKEVTLERSLRMCVSDVVREKTQEILDSGGGNSLGKAIPYNGKNYSYLCYRDNYFAPCYNLYPALELVVEEELRASSIGPVQDCFNEEKEYLEDLGFVVSGQAKNYSIDVVPSSIKVSVAFDLRISDGERAQSFDTFDVRVASPLYDFISFAREIVNEESESCSSSYIRMMLFKPAFSITRTDYKASKIYEVRERLSNQTFRFATRGCVL